MLVGALTASAEPPANLAQPNAPTGKVASLWEQDFLTGDWGGARRTLCEHGIDITATYTGETFGIVSGGLKRGAVYDGLVTLALDADLEKLVGWPGATFHASGFYPHGDSGTIKYAGDIGVFSNIDFYDSYRLYELYLDQQFFGEKLSLRVGQLGYDTEFAASDFAELFINSCFGLPTAITGNVPQPSYAIAALGARVKVQPTEWLYAQAAIYDGNPATASSPDPSPNAAATNEFNHYGTHWALRSDEGALVVGEVGV
jgi:porin